MTCNFILFILFFTYLFFEVEPFPPGGRVGHSSILVGNKIYFFGGIVNHYDSCSIEVFYLDVSQSFQSLKGDVLPWNDLTQNVKIPLEICWGTVLLSDNNQTVYSFDGFTPYNSSGAYSFNLNSSAWTILDITNISDIPGRSQIDGVIDRTGKIYIFGGSNIGVSNQQMKYFNDMIILDTVNKLSWSDSVTSPNKRISYTATLLRNGVIVYIGGTEYDENNLDKGDIDINQINCYDTKTSTWSLVTAKVELGVKVDNRHAHRSVLVPDGRIIIHGGGAGEFDVRVTPSLAILNTNTEPYEWIVPEEFSTVGPIPSLMDHSINLVGNYMMVTFGTINDPSVNKTSQLVLNTNLYLLDIRNYTWVDTFEPITFIPNIPKNRSVNKLRTLVVSIELSGILSIAILIGFFCYKWYQKRKRYNKWFKQHAISFN